MYFKIKEAYIYTQERKHRSRFSHAIIGKFGALYPRSPNEEDITQILEQKTARGRCLEASTACTDHGRTARLLGKVYTKGFIDIAV
jgi:hypothetical protein